MPEPTREEAKKAFVSLMVSHPHFRDLASIALAALEDAERIDWIESRHGISISERTEDGGWKSVCLAYAGDDGSMLMIVQEMPPLRAAIDRARGATP